MAPGPRAAYSLGMSRRTGILDPAPPAAGVDDGGSGGWSWLVTASDRFEAEVLRGMLENAGVPVVLDGFDGSPFAWMYPSGNINAPVRVMVPTGLLEVARLELLESSLIGPDRLVPSEPARPHRQARRVSRPLGLIVAVLTALAVAWIIIVEVAGFVPCATNMFCIN